MCHRSAMEVNEILKKLGTVCHAAHNDPENFSAVVEILRLLKKRAVFTQILDNDRSEELLSHLTKTVDVSSDAATLSLQLTFNLVACDEKNAAPVWSAFKSRLVDLMSSAPDEAALLTHICARKRVFTPSDDEFSSLFNALRTQHTDDSVLAIESLALLPGAFETFDSESRVVVYECLNTVLSHCKTHEVDPGIVRLLEDVARRFETLADAFALLPEKRLRTPDETEIQELIAALDLLGTASASDDYRSFVQKPFLIVSGASFFKALHDSQQLSDDSRKSSLPLNDPPVEKMEVINEVRSGIPCAGVTDSPSFELKQKLLRLIGNLVHRNESAQNLVRECGGLVPLLNSCRMDARNPYLMQWAILAIRNMCEGNMENQRMIESLKNEGLAPTVRAMLDEFGTSGDKLEQAVLRIKKH